MNISANIPVRIIVRKNICKRKHKRNKHSQVKVFVSILSVLIKQTKKLTYIIATTITTNIYGTLLRHSPRPISTIYPAPIWDTSDKTPGTSVSFALEPNSAKN